MNKKTFPKLKWVDVSELSPSGYREILVMLHKHNARDWQVIHGWVEPINDYTDFKIMAKPAGLSSHYPDIEIPVSEILKVGIVYPTYGDHY